MEPKKGNEMANNNLIDIMLRLAYQIVKDLEEFRYITKEDGTVFFANGRKDMTVEEAENIYATCQCLSYQATNLTQAVACVEDEKDYSDMTLSQLSKAQDKLIDKEPK